MIDVLLLYPIESDEDRIDDPWFRKTLIAGFGAPLFQATMELEQYLGRRVVFREGSPDQPTFGGERMAVPAHRSLGAVVLATHLERAGLRWEAVDPGPRDLGFWRRRLEQARRDPPRCIALSTTFIVSDFWLTALCSLIRRILPGTKLIVGGYYYATNVRRFLSLDADVCCVGEGEIRLPQIVRAIAAGTSLEQVPGLYLRRPGGVVLSTGRVEPLDLNDLPPPDWSLAKRIEPPIDPEHHRLEYELETQRGCVFKCEFCTYRTLAELSIMTPEKAVDAILRVQHEGQGAINLRDATATFPRDRWRRILELLIARGGSRFPIWAYARASDIDDEAAALMRGANVRLLFIGQESGDQRVLNLMRKGTRADHVPEVMRRLQRHGIYASVSFIYGFPGETAASIAATRDMIGRLNEGAPGRPAAPFYSLTPFTVQELSSVGQREELRDLPHYFGYQGGSFPIERVVAECMDTLLRTSRIPHAPVFARFLAAVPNGSGISLPFDQGMIDLFHWLKAIERGICIFLERDLEGRRPNQVELERVRAQIIARMSPARARQVAGVKLAARGKAMVLRRLQAECAAEAERGVGTLTRLLVARAGHTVTGSLGAAWRSFVKGEIVAGHGEPLPVEVEAHAAEPTQRSIEQARVVKLRPALRPAPVASAVQGREESSP